MAETEVIAFIEDHVHVPPGWAPRICERVDTIGAIAAGPVDDAAGGFAARAAFLCEYSAALPPVATGPQRFVPGNNTAYPAALLLLHISLLRDGAWEGERDAALRGEGVVLKLEEEVRADKRSRSGSVSTLPWGYHYSRAWAGRRRRGAPFARRVMGALKSMVLPSVLLARILGRGLRCPR